MGRWFCGLVVMSAFAGGCAAPTPAEVHQQSTGDGGVADLAGSGGGGGGGGGGPCVNGASCTTTNPGDCAMGTVSCSGGVATCVPNVTTQRCYDGPANTVNVGVCKAGTQTCIGALGACSGAVKPAAVENCFNDLDDDCDGRVNNGCPTAISTGTPRALTAIGDPNSGTAFSLRCPTGSFVSKMQMWGDNNAAILAVDSLDAYCGTPTLVRGVSSYTVTVAVSGTALSVGTDRPATPTTTFTCNTGFSPGWYTPGTGANGANGGIDGVGLTCANTTVALDAANHLNFSMTAAPAASSSGNNPDGYLATTRFDDNCNAGEVLIGYDGKLGNFITYFQPICAPLVVVYK